MMKKLGVAGASTCSPKVQQAGIIPIDIRANRLMLRFLLGLAFFMLGLWKFDVRESNRARASFVTSGNVAVIISILSLLFTGYSAYRNYLVKHYKLSIAIYPYFPSMNGFDVGWFTVDGKQSFAARVVFLNLGDATETIIASSLALTGVYEPHELPTIGAFGSGPSPALVLKPGDALPIVMEIPFGTLMNIDRGTTTKRGKISILVLAAGPGGEEKRVFEPFIDVEVGQGTREHPGPISVKRIGPPRIFKVFDERRWSIF